MRRIDGFGDREIEVSKELDGTDTSAGICVHFSILRVGPGS
jgi:hypothetical protein